MKGINVNIKVESNAKEIKRIKDNAIEKALEEIGKQCVNYTTLKCPVDTGNLRGSYHAEVKMDEEAVYVGTDVEYAPFVLRRIWPFTRGWSLCSCPW